MKVLINLSLFTGFIVIGGLIVDNQLASKATSLKHHETTGSRYSNTSPVEPNSLRKTLGIMSRYFTEKKIDPVPTSALPVEELSKETLDALGDDTIHLIKLGHSSVLLKVYGETWLLDPVFSERASPFSFMGPKRFHRSPIEMDAIDVVDKILISHNHYDHLDKKAILALASKTKRFLVPLGVKQDLIHWGVEAKKIQEFSWWQEQEVDNGMIAFTPTQHFSGRSLSDHNSTLWGSWVIKTRNESLYFSGDSGYFSGFQQIGEKYGPFEITMIETGAYDKDWPDIHMTPQQSVQAHIDLKGKHMIPIHNGTFDLAFHAWYEPLDLVESFAKQLGVNLTTPITGQILSLNKPINTDNWWANLK